MKKAATCPSAEPADAVFLGEPPEVAGKQGLMVTPRRLPVKGESGRPTPSFLAAGTCCGSGGAWRGEEKSHFSCQVLVASCR
jgi:hypothetical protein